MKYADYISKIEIDSLWLGHKHIVWELHPEVNVLSGRNGEGKSTILNKLVKHLLSLPDSGELASQNGFGVKMAFAPQGASTIRYDIIRSFDRQFQQNEGARELPGVTLRTELDWQLYLLQRRYLDYQVNVGNRMVQLLTNGSPEAQAEAMRVASQKNLFLDIVDELFGDTGKTIDRTSNELSFQQFDTKLSPYLLSSGEKQMLLILLTALTQDLQPYALFMDEPEVSLHFEWQKRLIALIRQLNPHAQIILTTHSPAVIMDGWEDHVTEVSEITR